MMYQAMYLRSSRNLAQRLYMPKEQPLLRRHFASVAQANGKVAAKEDVKGAPQFADGDKVTHYKGDTRQKELSCLRSDQAMKAFSEDLAPNEWTQPNPIYTKEERATCYQYHVRPQGFSDKLAYGLVYTMRRSFDLLSGFTIGKHMETINERDVLRRMIFLETVAGVPPMMAAMVRHLQSLRLMRKDGGWIHTLLEEAENERMHLMIALSLTQPGKLMSLSVLGVQLIFCNFYFLAYLISPRFCHRFTGYLEEEAVKTYSYILELQAGGKLPEFENLTAPQIAIQYYQLPQNAVIADMMECVRADEAHHRDVNHTFASMETTQKNPIGMPNEK